MKIRLLSFALALLVSACGSKTEPTNNPAPADPSAAPAADKVEPEAKVDAPKPAVDEPEKAAEAAPAIPAPAGLLACKAPADAVAATPDADDPWALPYTVQGCPAVPSVFGTVAFGMDRSEVGAALGEGAKVNETGSAYLYLNEFPFKLQLAVRFSDANKVEMLTHKIDAKGFEILKAAWGEPVAVAGLSRTSLNWFNPETGLRVYAEAEKWSRKSPEKDEDEEVDGYHLRFEPYSPVAALLGADGIVGKDIIGKTIAELSALYPHGIEQVSAEEAQAKLDKLGLDADTAAKAKALGAAEADTTLHLPAVETDTGSMLVALDWAEGKVSGYSFALPAGDDKALAAELLAVVGATLGAPTASTKEDDGFVYTFAAAHGQVVTLKPGYSGKGWRLAVAKP